MTLRSLWVGALVTLAACEAPTAPSDPARLEQARALWASQGSGAYSFELNRGCNCLWSGRQVLVTVAGGSVTKAEYTNSKTPVESTFLSYIPTVVDLFDLIGDALDRDAASLTVSYDPIYGYPTRIEIDYSATTADDEVSFAAQDLQLSTAFTQRP